MSSSHGSPPELPAVGLLGLLRFTAELGMLGALGYGGWHLTAPGALSVVLAVSLPLAAAVVWARWVAPRAASRLPDPRRLAVELVLFAAAAVLLGTAGPNPLTGVLAAGLFALFLVSLPHRRTETGPR